jgi:hypothetical protein
MLPLLRTFTPLFDLEMLVQYLRTALGEALDGTVIGLVEVHCKYLALALASGILAFLSKVRGIPSPPTQTQGSRKTLLPCHL